MACERDEHWRYRLFSSLSNTLPCLTPTRCSLYRRQAFRMAPKRPLQTVLVVTMTCACAAFAPRLALHRTPRCSSWRRVASRGRAIRPPLLRMEADVDEREPIPMPAAPQSFVDTLGTERDMTMDEQLDAIRREIQMNAAQALEEARATGPVAETGATDAGGGSGNSSEEESSDADFDKYRPPGFMDEVNNILWPGPRRSAQLTVLTFVAQFFFVLWIIAINVSSKGLPFLLDNITDAVTGLINSGVSGGA
ncbi:unnamed protein product [Phaeothamnion confervicola]